MVLESQAQSWLPQQFLLRSPVPKHAELGTGDKRAPISLHSRPRGNGIVPSLFLSPPPLRFINNATQLAVLRREKDLFGHSGRAAAMGRNAK